MSRICFLTVVAVSLVGCSAETIENRDILCECFSVAAYDAYRAERAPKPQPAGCCKKCTNGKVRSGDGLAWVACPCPDSCECKCKDGKCQIKK